MKNTINQPLYKKKFNNLSKIIKQKNSNKNSSIFTLLKNKPLSNSMHLLRKSLSKYLASLSPVNDNNNNVYLESHLLNNFLTFCKL